MFELSEGTVKVTPEHLALPEFKAIYETDKSKDKSTAFKELSYIFFMCDFKSPYFSYPKEKKGKIVSGDIMKDPAYKPSKKVQEGMDLYLKLNETPEMRMLKAWENKIDEIADFIANATLDIKSINAITKAGIDNVKIVESAQKLREIVEKKLTQKSHLRGNKTEAMFENPQ